MARLPNSSRQVPWRVFSGGHLGRLAPDRQSISALLAIDDGTIWTCVGSTIMRWQAGQWTTSHVVRTNDAAHAFAWYRDQLWAVGSELLVHAHGEWETAATPFGMVKVLHADQTGTLWAGTVLDGLWRTANGRDWEPLPLPNHETNIAAVCSGAAGALWVACQQAKAVPQPLYIWNSGEWDITAPPAQARLFRNIQSLNYDAHQRLWVGTFEHGIWRWHGATWQRFRATDYSDTRPSLPANSIFSIVVDRYARVWVATHNGIGLYDGERWRLVIVAPEGVAADGELSLWTPHMHYPTCLFLDAQERLLIGTSDGQMGWIDTTQMAYDNPLQYNTAAEYQPTLVPQQDDQQGS